MKQPDQASSRIRDMFTNQFVGRSGVDELAALKEQGPLVFGPEDPIYQSPELLDRLVMQICAECRITIAYFEEKYKLYAIRVLGYDPQKALTQRSNMLKMMRKGHITMRRFLEFVCRVLELPLEKVRFEFVQPTQQNSKLTVDVEGLSRSSTMHLSEE